MTPETSSPPFSLRKALGPGILVAGAAIGGSHIVSSTQAGADFGWALLPILFLVNLFKYPFFLFAQKYTAVAGETVLHGYQRLGPNYLRFFLAFTLLNAAWSIGGVALVTGFLLTYLPFLSDVNPALLTGVVAVVCVGIALGGRYRALDATAKVVVGMLALSTVAAVVLALGQGFGGPPEEPISPYTLASFGFVIVFMGWMPAPIDITAWASLWMGSREKQTGQKITLRGAMLDFHIGYLASVILAFFFLALGALVLWNQPQETAYRAMPGVRFATTFIGLYASSIGEWSRYLVWLAAVTCMFSTTLTCIDGWPRTVAFGLHLQSRFGRENPEASYRGKHAVAMAVMVGGAILLVMLFFRHNLINQYLATAMTISFLTTPFFALINYRIMGLPHIPPGHRPRGWIKWISLTGMAFFILFALIYLIWQFVL